MHPVPILVALLLLLLARRTLHTRRRQERLHGCRRCRVPWALLLQPYALLMMALVGWFLVEAYALFRMVVRYDWLNPHKFDRPEPDSDFNLEEFNMAGVLRVLVGLSPVAMAVTLCVTARHLLLHVPARPAEFAGHLRWMPTFSHDLSIQVVLLPLVYGMFSLDNVVQLLYVFTGDTYRAARGPTRDPQGQVRIWNATVVGHVEMYDSNAEIADLYEAWALNCFGLLCFALVRRQVHREAPTVRYLIDTVTRHLSGVALDDSQDMRVLRELILLQNPQELLFKPLQQTSRLGIMVFVYTYAAKSLYSLGLTFLAWPPFNLNVHGTGGLFPAICSLRPYAAGAAMLASGLAILNIVVFERSLSVILDNHVGFRPVAKFLSVKVLVSIAFFQNFLFDTVLCAVLGFSQMQGRLYYSTLICCEVLPLSVMVLLAWRPAPGDWHEGDRVGTEEDGRVGVVLADEDGDGHLATDEYARSRQLSTSAVSARRPMPCELTAVLELRGDPSPQDGRALEQVIHALTAGRILAEYRPAVLYRQDSRPSSFRASSMYSEPMASCSGLLGSVRTGRAADPEEPAPPRFPSVA